ncbi:hypothetical protein KC320_g5981 [Hortaea werneckii]|nr:hypothetical protein KC320_g5981 [Hortaea werneckii]
MDQNTSNCKELKASWKKDVQVPVMKLDEVAKHNTRKDIWMVIHGGGGPDALLEVAGTDATSAYEDVGHSEDAREIMQPFLAGHVEGASDSGGTPDGTPTLSVVRSNSEISKEQRKPTSLRGPRTELAAFALGTAALVYFVRHTNLPLPGLVPHPHFKQSGSGGSFLQGFLLASATASVVGTASALYLSKLTNLEVDFSKLPAHKASKYTFALREKTELSQGIYRFVFDLPTSASVLGLPIGQHVAIRGSVEDTSVTRSYTPVSNNRDLGRLELLIRIYPDGQLGQYLKALQPGDKVDIRGPKGAMRYRKGMSKELGMVGGGTGITPLFQLIRAICEDKTDTTKISLVYANRSEADIMLRDRLDTFAEASNGQFTV